MDYLHKEWFVMKHIKIQIIIGYLLRKLNQGWKKLFLKGDENKK